MAEVLKGLTMLRGEPRRTDAVSVCLVLRTMQERQVIEMRKIKEMQDSLATLFEEFRTEAAERHSELQATATMSMR